jgi:hypothetical protein
VPIPLTNGPGVYIQELPNPVQPIVGVPTSVAAFYGPAPQGIVDFPFQVNSWGDYENQFGGLDRGYPLSYAVYLFFLNGGTTALVVRYNDGTLPASAKLSQDTTLVANSPGAWAEQLTATVDMNNLFDASGNTFNLTITQTGGAVEFYPAANLSKGSPQYLATLLTASQFVDPAASTIGSTVPKVVPPATVKVEFTLPSSAAPAPASGQPADGAGTPPAAATGTQSSTGTVDPISLGNSDQATGIYALLKADIFNILCLPYDPSTDYDPGLMKQNLDAAAAFCTQQRAMLIVDPPRAWTQIAPPLQFPTISGNQPLTAASPNAAVYYPNLVVTDITGANFNVGPCGAVAGVWAATDSSRGVWKAPAGTAATITGITDLTVHVDDGESGILNPLAVDALRTMPAVGPVVWGARTTVGLDQLPNQWKYLPVRRLALYIEESLRRGTQWSVFEPNDEPLWSSLRLNVTTFMQGLFAQGAFAGTTPAQGYLVQCDANNNPPAQVDLGIVNILVGFAPLYPAEFVIINIQQQADQA